MAAHVMVDLTGGVKLQFKGKLSPGLQAQVTPPHHQVAVSGQHSHDNSRFHRSGLAEQMIDNGRVMGMDGQEVVQSDLQADATQALPGVHSIQVGQQPLHGRERPPVLVQAPRAAAHQQRGAYRC